jgi:thiol-disulfide isomerase/thioredoxin
MNTNKLDHLHAPETMPVMGASAAVPHAKAWRLAKFAALARLTTLSLLAGLCALTAVPATCAGTGQPAPAFSLPGIAAPINLNAYLGKVVYLDFWASWCGPCKKSFPWMNKLQAKYAAKGLQVIAVNLDADQADAKQFLETTPAMFDIAFDPKGMVAQQYHVKGMPTSLLIGRDGKIVEQHAGFNDFTQAVLEQEIQALMEPK